MRTMLFTFSVCFFFLERESRERFALLKSRESFSFF
jgi:hypothetical protein